MQRWRLPPIGPGSLLRLLAIAVVAVYGVELGRWIASPTTVTTAVVVSVSAVGILGAVLMTQAKRRESRMHGVAQRLRHRNRRRAAPAPERAPTPAKPTLTESDGPLARFALSALPHATVTSAGSKPAPHRSIPESLAREQPQPPAVPVAADARGSVVTSTAVTKASDQPAGLELRRQPTTLTATVLAGAAIILTRALVRRKRLSRPRSPGSGRDG